MLLCDPHYSGTSAFGAISQKSEGNFDKDYEDSVLLSCLMVF